jgi:type II secretory pathway component PulF
MTVEAIQQFHRELLGIASLGIPLDLGFTRTKQDLSEALDEIAVSIQQSLSEAPLNAVTVSEIPDLSPNYRSALATWLATDGSPIAFESLVMPGVVRQQARKLWNASMLQPLVILALSYFVMIYICSVTVPKLEAVYAQTGHAPGIGASIMIAMRKLLMVWIPAVPILVACLIFYRIKRTQTISSKFIDSTKTNQQALADLATARLAELLRVDIALPKALELVPQLSQLPLMQWAISEKTNKERVLALQFATATYRRIAEVRCDRMRSWVPPLAMGLVGGGIVLLVGLSVFWPVAELLYHLTKPEGVR